jgi:hypothetical protein
MSVYFTAYFTNSGAPRTGLSATITVYKVSDNSAVVNAAAMTEIAGGGYKYLFSAYAATEEYYAVADGGAALADSERYAYGATMLTDAQVNAEADTALIDYDPPTKTEMDSAFTEVKGVTWSASTDTLEHIRDKETDIETDTQDLQTQVGVDGAGLTSIGDTRLANLDATISSRNSVIPDPAGTLAAYDPPTKNEIDSAFTEIKGATWTASTDTLEHIRDKETDIESDTSEIQAEFADGGRTDLLIDGIKTKTDELPSGIAKNVALSNFAFLLVLSSDHVSAATGKTVTATISKDGGAFASCSNSVIEISNGMYKINLTQTEMNADIITIIFTASGCDTRVITIYTV